MANQLNFDLMTEEQKKEARSKGGRKRAESIRARKKMKDELSVILALPIKRSVKSKATKLINVDSAKALEDFKGMNTTVQTQVLLKVAQMAMTGNIKAMEFILGVMGENKQTLDINTTGNLKIHNQVDTLADDLFGDDAE